MRSFILTSLTIFFMFFINIGSAQDTIILKNGMELTSKIIEITNTEISYKNWSNIDGPIYRVKKSEISKIKYQNGTSDVFDAFSNSYNEKLQINLEKSAEIEMKTSAWGTSFWQNGVKLTKSQVNNIIKNTNIEAYREIQLAKSYRLVGGIFSGVGGGIALWSLIDMASGGEPSWTTIGIAAGAVTVGLLIGIADYSHTTSAIMIYNKGIKQIGANTINLKFGLCQHGIGLNLNF